MANKPTQEQIDAAKSFANGLHLVRTDGCLLANEKEHNQKIDTILAALEAYEPVDVELLKHQIHYVWNEPSPDVVKGFESAIDYLVEKAIINGK